MAVHPLRIALLATLSLVAATDLPAAEVDYVRDIKPILRSRCYACHGAVRQRAGLRLDAGPLILKGSENGPIVEPGKADESVIIEAVLGDGRPRMPPKKEGSALSEHDVAFLRDWINQGAKAPNEPTPDDPRNHWAFRPPVRSAVPVVAKSSAGDGANKGVGAANPIDAFIAAERTKHGLRASPAADKAVLLRRVYLDLIGLPPSREELHAFVADDAPEAYEKIVDRLLASPRHAERWGRHWMDVWRYSDPFGLGEEYRYSQRHIWRWRDWIIESLEQDKGYDQMIVEMLAGDEIAPADPQTLRATGYLARNWYKFNRNVWIQDSAEYTAAGFLGLTLRCARCHDHKYDPISQQDYYQFRAFFEPHDVRIDAVPGQPDKNKDGIARAFDGTPDAATYLFQRGDERMPDKSRSLPPKVPGLFSSEATVRPVSVSASDYARALGPASDDARRIARAELEQAAASVKLADESIAAARRQLDAIASGTNSAEHAAEPFLHDTFAAARPELWQVVRGHWAWESGRLVCKSPSPFATVTTKTNHPANFMGRIRYRTTGGGIGSVGFSYDVAGESFQAVYTNASDGSAVRAFHRVKGQDTYPAEGIVPYPIKLQEEVTLDFAVRGNLLNTWVNGKRCNVYRLGVARQEGVFSLWTHDATAEFLEVRLAALPDGAALAERAGEDRPSPVGGAISKVDAERAVAQAEDAAALAHKKREAAEAVVSAVEARIAAEQVRYTEPVDQAKWMALAHAAAKLERSAAVLQAAESLRLAEEAASKGRAIALPNDAQKKALADAEQGLTTAKKAQADAVAAATKEDAAYTPLVRFDPASSSGRRLALARWIADRNNPLTARVAVNHVWMRHFGKPLVATMSNFGLNGQKPTHPELLDWLAVEFMESGWSMKHLHRLVVLSDTYRLASHDVGSGNANADPENRYYWRMNSRRMEAEVVRDSLLAAAGQLDATMGGLIIDEKQGQTSRRRSVYFRFNTEYKMQFLDQFDAASPTECYQRHESVIPQQSLALSNSALALNQSRLLAKRLTQDAAEAGAFVTAAFEQVLCRPPTPEEQERCQRFLREQAEVLKDSGKLTPFPPSPDAVTAPAAAPAQRAREDLVHTLFNYNDFVTIR